MIYVNLLFALKRFASLLFILLVVDGLHVSREVDCPGAGVVAELASMVLPGEFFLALFQVNYSVMLPQNGWIFACKATFLANECLHLALGFVT